MHVLSSFRNCSLVRVIWSILSGMSTFPANLDDVADFLRKELSVERFAQADRGGIHRALKRQIRRIGLALEPFPGVGNWVREQRLDALWLHRHWQLNLTGFPSDVGILCHHLPFDEALTTGYNPRLAKALKATSELEVLGYKQDKDSKLPPRPLGMLFDIEQKMYDDCLTSISTMFKGYDRAEARQGSTIRRVAVVGAMTDALVREAARRGAGLYLTGAYRMPGQRAVEETGITVIAVGHRRCEEWGMLVLADIIRERWPVECVVCEPGPNV